MKRFLIMFCVCCGFVIALNAQPSTVLDAARNSNIEADSEPFRKKYFQGGKGTDTAHLNAQGHDLFLPVAEQFLLQHMKR
jgi:hypothetical protein